MKMEDRMSLGGLGLWATGLGAYAIVGVVADHIGSKIIQAHHILDEINTTCGVKLTPDSWVRLLRDPVWKEYVKPLSWPKFMLQNADKWIRMFAGANIAAPGVSVTLSAITNDDEILGNRSMLIIIGLLTFTGVVYHGAFLSPLRQMLAPLPKNLNYSHPICHRARSIVNMPDYARNERVAEALRSVAWAIDERKEVPYRELEWFKWMIVDPRRASEYIPRSEAFSMLEKYFNGVPGTTGMDQYHQYMNRDAAGFTAGGTNMMMGGAWSASALLITGGVTLRECLIRSAKAISSWAEGGLSPVPSIP